MASASCRRMPPAAASAPASAVRSSSELDFVFGSAATMARRDAPIADASADAEPPPGVGSGEANAASTSRSGCSISTENDLAFLDHGADRRRADANEIDRRSGDDDRVHLLADFEAADAIVAIE